MHHLRTLANVRESRRWLAQFVGLGLVAVALVVLGRMWGRQWVLNESCSLTGCRPASMALIGWATQAAMPAFGLVAISGHRRTRTGRRLLWIAAALVLVPGLVFLPSRHDPWIGLAFDGTAAHRAFGVGLVAAWLALASLGFVMPVALWIEEQAYRRARRQNSKGTSSIRVATRFLIGYTAVAALLALAIAEFMIA
jgi:hypothetical protein